MIDGELILVLDNTLGAIEGGRARIARHLEPLAFDARTLNRLEVVFEELISNIIRHGFGRDTEQSILVAVVAEPETVRFTIEDDGAPFNPLDADEPAAPESLETAQLGGLGISTVRRFATSLGYEAGAASAAWSDFVRHGDRPANRIKVAIAAQP